MLQDYQIKTLMLVYELEKTIGDIYAVFAERFPEHKTLWNTLAKEEQEHAEAVRQLYRLTYEKQVLFDEGSIKTEAVQSIVDYLKRTYDAAKRGKFTAAQAVSITYDTEKSLIEKNIFKHFKVAPQLAETLQYLQDGSQHHIRLAKKELEKIQRAHGKPKG
ncbi:hypothetical protein U27_01726 [Candidatus Vecturithrix granuli]|uniref:DUF2202 domain-containing protein n=1 Tax=Vecturithrix granuli TaxID=1499967 RepID=A0A0S6W909_VECG1|nr:hypothetical protein U27_01726 [Candidatus Vecturithrix granuli]